MITSHPNTTIAIKGHAKELNCTARGERPIIIRWEKGDTVIDPDRVTRYTIATKDSGDEVVSTLKVSAHAPVPGEPTAITSASSGGKRGVQKYPPPSCCLLLHSGGSAWDLTTSFPTTHSH